MAHLGSSGGAGRMPAPPGLLSRAVPRMPSGPALGLPGGLSYPEGPKLADGAMMYGVIFLWRVRPEKRAEHAEVMKQTLDAERTRCPEVLLNLTFGGAADGTCAEIQVYADEATSRRFPERGKREDAALDDLWSRYGDLCVPDVWQTI